MTTTQKKRGRPALAAMVSMGPVRVPPEVKREYEEIAEREDRGLASVMRTALRQWLEHRRKAAA